jgi:hypothetical protein
MRLVDYMRIKGYELPDDTEVLIADQIWDQIDQGPERAWTRDNFPCLAPLFPNLLVEARAEATGALAGVMFSDVTGLYDVKVTVVKGRPVPLNCRWILKAEGVALLNHRVFKYPGMVFIHLDELGRFWDDDGSLHIFEDERFHDQPKSYWAKHDAMPLEIFRELLPFAMKAVSIAHCKNVRLEPLNPPRPQRRKMERDGFKTTVYKTLVIRPMSGKSAEAKPYQGLMRYHIVHGHFRTYTAEAPLFGRLTGTFYVPNFVRGEKSNGEVVKNYKVVYNNDKSQEK